MANEALRKVARWWTGRESVESAWREETQRLKALAIVLRVLELPPLSPDLRRTLRRAARMRVRERTPKRLATVIGAFLVLYFCLYVALRAGQDAAATPTGRWVLDSRTQDPPPPLGGDLRSTLLAMAGTAAWLLIVLGFMTYLRRGKSAAIAIVSEKPAVLAANGALSLGRFLALRPGNYAHAEYLLSSHRDQMNEAFAILIRRARQRHRSMRRIRKLKRHARAVDARFSLEFEKFDDAPDKTLQETVRLTMSFAERHAAGRHGALLSPGDLEEAGESRLRGAFPHTVKLAMLVVAMCAVAFALHAVNLPEGVANLVNAGAMLVGLALVLGPHSDRAKDALNSFTTSGD